MDPKEHNRGQEDRAEHEARPPRDTVTIITEALTSDRDYKPPSDSEDKEASDKGWDNNH